MAAPETTLKEQSQRPDAQSLSRVQKLACLLVILGPDSAAQILRGFDPFEVEGICTEMAKFNMIGQELQHEVLREFSEVAVEASTAVRGGVEVTRATLEKAIGLFKATELLSRVAPTRSSVTSLSRW